MCQPSARKGREVSTLAVRSPQLASPGASPLGWVMSPTRSASPRSRWLHPWAAAAGASAALLLLSLLVNGAAGGWMACRPRSRRAASCEGVACVRGGRCAAGSAP